MLKFPLFKLSMLVLFLVASLLTCSKVFSYSVFDISLTVSPQYPAENQTVTASIKSYTIELAGSKITWSLNGKILKDGVGETSVDFNSGKNGSVSNLKVSVTAPDGQKIEKTFSISPASVDLAWEANSYAPPFYKGKAAFPLGGDVKIAAFPKITDSSGNVIDSSKLIYKWKNNGTNLGSDSGYGKSSLKIAGQALVQPISIEVEVSTPDGSKTAVGKISVAPERPKILIYENNPLYGIFFNKAVQTNFILDKDEVSFTAFPFSFSASSRNSPSLNISWQMNGQKIDAQTDPGTVTFRKTSGTTGTANIQVGISSDQKTFQASSQNFILDFSKGSVDANFGL